MPIYNPPGLATSDLSGYAPLAGPALTGNPTAPTASASDSDTSLATTSFVQAAIPLLASPLHLTLNAQTGTTYTPVPGDDGKLVTLANASAITVTLPKDATQAVVVGSQIHFAWKGVGQPTFALEATAAWLGTTAPSPGLKIRAVGSFVTAIKVATDTWALVGDLAA